MQTSYSLTFASLANGSEMTKSGRKTALNLSGSLDGLIYELKDLLDNSIVILIN